MDVRFEREEQPRPRLRLVTELEYEAASEQSCRRGWAWRYVSAAAAQLVDDCYLEELSSALWP